MLSRRMLLPGALAVTAVVMAVGQMTWAAADSTTNLDCPSDVRVVGDVDYPTAAVVLGETAAVDATENVVNGSIIPGSTDSLQVDSVAADIDTTITTVTQPDGDVTAIVTLEGSAEEGWRPATLEMCAQ